VTKEEKKEVKRGERALERNRGIREERYRQKDRQTGE